MGNKLSGRIAVVTGGGGGIGRAVALALSREGASILVVDPGSLRGGGGSDKSPADKVVDEINKEGGKAIADYSSVADFKAAAGMIERCVKEFGSIDILVNSAGILRERMVWNLSEEDWDMLISVHLKGTFNCSRPAAALMRQQKYGRIINLSAEAWLGTVGQANYSAAKGGIVSFTRSAARDLGKYGVTVNAVAPRATTRLTDTEEVRAGMKRQYEAGLMTREYYEAALSHRAPDSVAPLFVYLASDKAANINGQVFYAMKGEVGIYSQPVVAKLIYKPEANGIWTLEELEQYVPQSLLVGYINPAPAQTSRD